MAAPVTAPTGRGSTPALEVRQARRAVPAVPAPPPTRRQRRDADRRRRRGRWVPGVRAPASVAGRLLLVVLVAVVLAGGLLVLTGRRAGAPPVGAGGASAQAGASPARLLQGLLDARAAALAARDPALLLRAEGAGSTAQTADAALVRRLLAAHQTYDGLTFTAHDVVVESRAGDRIVLRARVARAAYELVAGDGTRTPQPGSDGATWRYVLVRAAPGWRLAEVTSPG